MGETARLRKAWSRCPLYIVESRCVDFFKKSISRLLHDFLYFFVFFCRLWPFLVFPKKELRYVVKTEISLGAERGFRSLCSSCRTDEITVGVFVACGPC